MSKRAIGKSDSNSGPNEKNTGPHSQSRAHRDDTPEAVRQHEQTPKTHPTSGENKHGARRKDD